MTETTTKRQLCRLNRTDERRLEDWVRDNIDRMCGEGLTQVQVAIEAAGVAHWSPNQLRHNAATRMRAACGRETAQVVLGHSRPETTDIYAEPPVMAAIKDVLRYG